MKNFLVEVGCFLSSMIMLVFACVITVSVLIIALSPILLPFLLVIWLLKEIFS